MDPELRVMGGEGGQTETVLESVKNFDPRVSMNGDTLGSQVRNNKQ